MLDIQNDRIENLDRNLENSQTLQSRVIETQEENLKSRDQKSKVTAKVASLILNAAILTKHQEYNLALNLLRTASNLDSKNIKVLRPLADALEVVQKFDEVLVVRKVIFQLEQTCEAAAMYGHALYKMNRDQDAKEMYFESLIRLTEEFDGLFEIYKNLGNILVREGDYEGAEEYYNKAYTLNSSSDVLLVNYGTLDVQRQDYQRAVECFRQAVQVNPKNDKAWVGLALMHRQFGDLDLSWANLESALDINPANRTAVHVCSTWAVQDQRLPQALEALQTYLSCVDSDSELSFVLINLFCMLNDFDKAMLEIERVTLLEPNHVEVLELKQKIRKLISNN